MERKQRLKRRRNQLMRYRAIMEEFDKYDCRIIPITVIWRKFIYPKFYISLPTLYRVLATDIEGELSEIRH